MCDVLGKSEMIVLSHLQIVKMTLLFIRFKENKEEEKKKLNSSTTNLMNQYH